MSHLPMKQTLISNHFTMKNAEKLLQTPPPKPSESNTSQTLKKSNRGTKRKALDQKTKPLEKKLKLNENDDQITTPVKKSNNSRNSTVFNPNLKGLLKSNENSIDLAYIFQNQPPSFNEKSTTQATFDTFKSNSFSSSINFEKNPIVNQDSSESQMKFLMNSINNFTASSANNTKKPFRKISFEEETNQVNALKLTESVENIQKNDENVKKSPILSQGTEDIIRGIKAKKMELEYEVNRKFEGSIQISKESREIIEKIKSKSSIREQLKENIKADIFKQNYDLPSEYKRIITKFETLEQSLMFHNMRKIPTFYRSLNESSKVSMREFQQILYIFPNEYDLKWEKNEGYKNESDLLINFPAEFLNDKTTLIKKLQIRKENFKEKTLECWKQQKSLIKDQVFCDPMIPEKELPPKPNQAPVEKLKDFLEKSQLKNKQLMEIMKETALKSDQKPDLLENSVEVLNLKKSGLSETLLAKIKEKEKHLSQAKKQMESMESHTTKLSKLSEMINIVDIIKYYYTLRGVSNIFLINLVNYIYTSNTQFILSEQEIMRLIEQIAVISPEWIKLVDNENGKIVRLNKEFPVFNVLKQLKAF